MSVGHNDNSNHSPISIDTDVISADLDPVSLPQLILTILSFELPAKRLSKTWV